MARKSYAPNLIDDNHIINRWPGQRYIAEQAYKGKMYQGIGETVEEAIAFCNQAILDATGYNPNRE